MSIFGNTDLFAQFESAQEDESDDEYDWERLNQVQEENTQLKIENDELRKTLRILTQPRNVAVKDSEKDGPIAQLLLFNNTIARHERESIEEFMRHYFSRYKSTPSFQSRPQHNALQCPRARSNSQKQYVEADEAFVVTNSIQFYSKDFCVDHLGDPVEKSQKLLLKVPHYDRICDVLNGEEQLEGKNETRTTRCCFNCGQTDHQLKDCPLPKNYKAINERKQKFMNQATSSPQTGTVRYHDDNNADDSRFSKFKAGIASHALRSALGISDREIPPYIYQMRMLGYPPGHLEEARVTGSGLSFFKDKNGDREEEDLGADKGPIDVDLIINFPGFNVDPEPHVIDKSGELRFPPMDPRHSVEVMISYHNHRNSILQKRKAEQEEEEKRSRKRHRPNHVSHAKNDDVREVDMETSDVEDGAEVQTHEEASEQKPIAAESDSNHVTSVDMTTDDQSQAKENPEKHQDDTVEDGEVVSTLPAQDDTVEDGEVVSTLPAQDDTVEDGEVVSNSSDYDVIEEQALIDGMEVGDLDEEELQLRREEILRQLESANMDNPPSDVEHKDTTNVDATPQLLHNDDSKDAPGSPPSSMKLVSGLDNSSPGVGSSCVSNASLPESTHPHNFSPYVMDKNIIEAHPQSSKDFSLEIPPQNSENFSPESPPQRTDNSLPESPPQKTDNSSPESPPQRTDDSFPESPPQKTDNFSPESPPQSTDENNPEILAQSVKNFSPKLFPRNTEELSPRSPLQKISPESPTQNPPESTLKSLNDCFHESPPQGNKSSSSESQQKFESAPLQFGKSTPDSPQRETSTSSVSPLALPVLGDSESKDCKSVSAEDPTDSSEGTPQQLPHRSKFAQGITQFEGYFKETKSSGVFSKLKNLLKSSPRSRDKTA